MILLKQIDLFEAHPLWPMLELIVDRINLVCFSSCERWRFPCDLLQVFYFVLGIDLSVSARWGRILEESGLSRILEDSMGIRWDTREFLGILEDFSEPASWSLLGFWGILPESLEKLEDFPFFFFKNCMRVLKCRSPRFVMLNLFGGGFSKNKTKLLNLI